MVFDEFQEPLQHWRYTVPTSGWSDPYWMQIGTISGRFEPVAGTETFLQNQAFADVTELLYTSYENRLIIKAGDGFIDSDGIQRKIAGQPEIWKHMIPHVVCRAVRTQWDITVS